MTTTFPKKLNIRKLYRIKQQRQILIGYLFNWKIRIWAYDKPMMSIGCKVMPISQWLRLKSHDEIIEYYLIDYPLSLPKLRKELRVFYAYLRKALAKKTSRKPVRRITRGLKRTSRVPKSKASPRKRGAPSKRPSRKI